MRIPTDVLCSMIEAGDFDEVLKVITRSVQTRTSVLLMEENARNYQTWLAEKAETFDAEFSDLMTAHAALTDVKGDPKVTARAIDLYRTARRLERDMEADQIARTIFHIDPEMLSK